MNGRIYDPVLAMFLSPDNFIQAPGSTIGFNRYSYCFNNPLKYTDPSGNFAIWEFIIGNVLIYTMEYLNNVLGLGMSPGEAFRNTSIVISASGNFSFGDNASYSAFYNYSSSSGAYYDSYSAMDLLHAEYAAEIYNSIYDDNYNPFSIDFGYRYISEEYARLTAMYVPHTQVGGVNDYPGGSFLRSSDVSVTFDANADNMVNPSLNAYFIAVMSKASLQGIYSVNISCTTDHPSNATRSAHTVANGARGLDINYINGVHVSKKNPYVKILQNIIKSTPGYLENYGPLIINKVSNGSVIKAPWARNIKGSHYDHIHLSVPRV